MKLISPVFSDNQPIPVDYSCRGRGLRPALTFSGVPVGSKSLALTLDDPDAPMGTFHHWVVWNIPVTDTLPGTTLPAGTVEGANSAGSSGYVPPCPPSGKHRYIFTLFALDRVLNISSAANTDAFEAAIAGGVLARTKLTGTFGK